MWYNNTTGTLKGAVTVAAAWAAGGTMGQKQSGAAAAGTQTAALNGGGNDGVSAPPGPYSTNKTEEYNGASWTAGGALGSGGYSGMGGGPQTATLFKGGASSGGAPGTYVAHYNGSSWTEEGAAPFASLSGAFAGTQTSGMASGGVPTPSFDAEAFTYDGSTWTAAPDLATGRYNHAAVGATGPVSMVAGGRTPASPNWITATEEFNVSTTVITPATWSSGGTYPTNASGAAVAGTKNAAIAFGGTVYPGPNGPTNISATYDGTSWALTPVINTSRSNSANAKNGSQTAALMIAGNAPGHTDACEEYNGASWSTVNTYPVSARIHDQGTGTQIAAMCSGGYGGGPGTAYLTTTCTYDGTNWTALGAPSDSNVGRFSGTTCGTQTAAVMFGGTSPGGVKVETWNGSTWAEESSAFNIPRSAGGSAGTSTNAIFFGGEPSGNGASTEHWDGTSFSTRPSLATSRYAMGSTGTATAGLSVGGAGGGVNETEEYTGETTAANIVTVTTS